MSKVIVEKVFEEIHNVNAKGMAKKEFQTRNFLKIIFFFELVMYGYGDSPIVKHYPNFEQFLEVLL